MNADLPLLGSQVCYLLPLDEDAIHHYRRELALSPTADVLDTLARAIAASPGWTERSDAVLVADRLASTPRLTLLGHVDEANEACLTAQANALNRACKQLRYVDYAQVEQDCAQLAVLLHERFGLDELLGFRFAAIPRGGLIVLGMLAYVLGLERAQLEAPHPPDAPLVVVDDCAVSGFRFGQFLRRCASEQVVFAPLYAHPDLCAAIETREPRVLACLSAQDLHDHGPERWGAEYPAWRDQKLAQMGEGRYWVGLPDHVCFPWNEPDRSVVNPDTRELEPGWRTIPPEMCLKNRLPPGVTPLPVQVQPEGKGPLKPSERVVFGDLGDEVVVGDLEGQKTFGLRDTAADMWRAIVKHGNLADAAAALLEMYAVKEATLQADLRALADDLLARGLLTIDA